MSTFSTALLTLIGASAFILAALLAMAGHYAEMSLIGTGVILSFGLIQIYR